MHYLYSKIFVYIHLYMYIWIHISIYSQIFPQTCAPFRRIQRNGVAPAPPWLTSCVLNLSFVCLMWKLVSWMQSAQRFEFKFDPVGFEQVCCVYHFVELLHCVGAICSTKVRENVRRHSLTLHGISGSNAICSGIRWARNVVACHCQKV